VWPKNDAFLHFNKCGVQLDLIDKGQAGPFPLPPIPPPFPSFLVLRVAPREAIPFDLSICTPRWTGLYKIGIGLVFCLVTSLSFIHNATSPPIIGVLVRPFDRPEYWFGAAQEKKPTAGYWLLKPKERVTARVSPAYPTYFFSHNQTHSVIEIAHTRGFNHVNSIRWRIPRLVEVQYRYCVTTQWSIQHYSHML